MRRLLPVAIFASAMAYLEAAVVVYLRRLVDVVEPWRDPGVYDATIAAIEVGREAATLVMLVALGWACGRKARTRVAFALFAFGVWDILYYGWLKALVGWPESLLTPDILFLIPLPWWGPVITPILVALLLAAGGVGVIALDDRGRAVRPRALDWSLMTAGVVLILAAFMADALAALPATAEALSGLRPGPFRWGPFCAGLAFLAAGVVRPLRSAGADGDAVRGR
ncbi:MAG TPA: hypothetical protein VGS03_14690 [Candidatus Polarisedimenticolia bacterium]|jgi:hypothetical protein|nr:hypothetical protein [Candidatus Polarisedimenticolia bacterium]